LFVFGYARIRTEIGQGARVLPEQLLELAERAGQHDFANRGGCDFADARKRVRSGSSRAI